jgi:hypothetical protein
MMKSGSGRCDVIPKRPRKPRVNKKDVQSQPDNKSRAKEKAGTEKAGSSLKDKGGKSTKPPLKRKPVVVKRESKKKKFDIKNSVI